MLLFILLSQMFQQVLLIIDSVSFLFGMLIMVS